MNTLLNNLKVSGSKRLAVLALATAGVSSLFAANAHAGDRYGHDSRGGESVAIGVQIGGGGWRGDDNCEVRETRVWVEPVYRTVCEKVWVEPVYKTTCDRVWVAPVTRTVCEKVWVPDRYECRTVVHRDRHGYTFRSEERVLVERGHFTSVERVVEVCAGHFDNVERQEPVCAGHFDNVERQEVVAPGHWEIRRERVVGRYEDHRSDDFRIGFEWRKH
jgi:hypothetical protein